SPRRAGRPMQHDGPSLFCFVVGPAPELRGCPVAELHAFHVGLEPAGKLVFGNVGRPVRWKRHVRKVVDLHLVVQGQGAITVAPVVADALSAVYDQSLELEDRLDRVSAGARHMAGRSPMRIGPETGRMGAPGMRLQLLKYSFPAVDRPDVPGQGQHVAPMAVGMKERLEQDLVASRKS